MFTSETRLHSAGFQGDGNAVLAMSVDGTAWLLPRTDPPDDLARATEEIEALTGLTVDASGAVKPLASVTWLQRREAVERQSGPPEGGVGTVTASDFDPGLIAWSGFLADWLRNHLTRAPPGSW